MDLCVHVCRHVYATAFVWSADNLWDSVLSYHMFPGDWTQVVSSLAAVAILLALGTFSVVTTEGANATLVCWAEQGMHTTKHRTVLVGTASNVNGPRVENPREQGGGWAPASGRCLECL